MRLAIHSDIHGNIHALEAVWTDLTAQAPDAVMCLGDLVGYGAFPNEVIDFVQQHDIPVLMGNYDDGVGSDRDDCGCVYKDPADDARGHQSLLWTHEHMTPERKAYLRSLPFDRRESYAGRRAYPPALPEAVGAQPVRQRRQRGQSQGWRPARRLHRRRFGGPARHQAAAGRLRCSGGRPGRAHEWTAGALRRPVGDRRPGACNWLLNLPEPAR